MLSNRLRLPRALFLAGLVLTLVTGQALDAQSVVWGSIEGRVVSSTGGPVGSVSVTLASSGTGIDRRFTSDRSGRFTVPLVAPGVYSLRVESLGYRPLVVTELSVPAGEKLPVEVTLTSVSGVVSEVDSTAAGVTYSGRQTRSGERIGSDAGRRLAFETGSLTEVAALSTSMDRYLGVEGLPGSMTTVIVDGALLQTTRHPGIRSEATASPLVDLPLLSTVEVLATPADVEWWGGGGALALTTWSGTDQSRRTGVQGGWSGDALRFSDEIEDASPGSSVWGTAAGRAELVPDAAFLAVVANAAILSTPTPARLDPSAAAGLAGVDAGLRDRLGSPGVEETTRVGGQARLDWWLDDSRRLALRAGVGYRDADADAYGPATLGFGIDPLQSSLDLSLAADYSSRRSASTILEVRGGLSVSQRDFRAGDVAQGIVAGSGSLLGSAVGSGGDASLVGMNLATTLRSRLASGDDLKFGVQIRGDRRVTTYSPYAGARYLFPDLGGIGGDPAVVVGATAREASFRTAEFGAFSQYAWAPAPDLRVAIGGRVDVEVIAPEVTRNQAFEDVSGLVNSDAPTSWVDVSAIASLAWDLTGGDGGSVLTASAALQTGDLDAALVHELSVNDGESRVRRFTGMVTDWPSQTLSTTASDLPPITVFGSDMQPPRHVRVRAGLRNRIGASTILFVGGALRSSDFLPRRRNLNLPVAPTGTGANGRPLYGDLRKLGELVALDGRSGRRFPEFDAILAVDPDGFSTYVAATIGIEHSAGPVHLSAAYTRSRTEDNWVGARTGVLDAGISPLLSETGTPWDEGRSDFDVPDRFVATAVLEASDFVSLGAAYRYASGLPFTPGFRPGVDVNADGSGFNDPAFVSSEVVPSGGWDCVQDMVGGFATRNGCRGEGRHSLDLRLELGLPLGDASFVVDALDLLESAEGVRDAALVLVDRDAPLAGAGTGVPVVANPDFGQIVLPGRPGRLLRVGVRIGGL